MVDPTIDQNGGTVTYNCQDNTGYTLTNTELDDTIALGFVIKQSVVSPPHILQEDQLDDSDFSNWADSSNLSQDTSTKYYGVSSALASSSGIDTSRLILTNLNLSPDVPYINDSAMFKLNSTSGFTDNCWVIWTSDRLGTAIVAGYGVNTSVSSTTFSYYNNATTSWTDTGVVLDTNWKKIAFSSEDTGGTMTFTVNGTTVYTGNASNIRAIVVRTSQSGKTSNTDRILHSDDAFYTSGGNTLVTPKAQPNAVKQWMSYSKTDITSGINRGTITYEFQWSSDGGSTWNGTWTALSDANLQAVSCDGDGQDAIKIRVTLDAYINLYTPLVNQIILNFTPTTYQLIGVMNS
jgi:hypothetical protein